MVVAPHCGANSLSVDLTSFEASATGGRKRFARSDSRVSDIPNTKGVFCMKINWKVRFRNKLWLGSFLSLIVSFVYSMLSLFDVFPDLTENTVLELLNQILTFLGLIGVLVDPTTAGLGDSERAMGYEEPWDDNVTTE